MGDVDKESGASIKRFGTTLEVRSNRKKQKIVIHRAVKVLHFFQRGVDTSSGEIDRSPEQQNKASEYARTSGVEVRPYSLVAQYILSMSSA